MGVCLKEEMLKLLQTGAGSGLFMTGIIIGAAIFILFLLLIFKLDTFRLKKLNAKAALTEIELKMTMRKDYLEQDLATLNMDVNEYGQIMNSFMQYPWAAYAKGYSGAKFFVKDKIFTVYVTEQDKTIIHDA